VRRRRERSRPPPHPDGQKAPYARHQDLVLRGAGYRGRSSWQHAVSGRTCRAPARRHAYDVFRRSCEYGAATSRCPGDSKPGLTQVPWGDSRIARAFVKITSSTRSLPTTWRHVFGNERRTSRCSQTRFSATDPTRVHPCVTMKGLSGEMLFTGVSRSVRKRAREARSERRDPSLGRSGDRPLGRVARTREFASAT
jgi:hypothetical protein